MEPKAWASNDAGLDELRAAVRQLDAALIALAAERTRLCRRIGELKWRLGEAVRNPAVERVVVESARRSARVHGGDPDVAEGIVRLLIEHSVERQLHDRAATGRVVTATGSGRLPVGR